MSTQHVQTKDEIDILFLFQNRDHHRHKLRPNLERRLMNPPHDFLRPHPFRLTDEPFIDEPFQSAPSRAPRRHDGHLRPAIDERLERDSIHLHVHVQHHHLREHLRGLIHRQGEIMLDVFSSNAFFDFPLRLDVERIRVHERQFLHPSRSHRLLSRPHLPHPSLKRVHVVSIDRVREFRVSRAQTTQRLRVVSKRPHHRSRIIRASIGVYRARVRGIVRRDVRTRTFHRFLGHDAQNIVLRDTVRA